MGQWIGPTKAFRWLDPEGDINLCYASTLSLSLTHTHTHIHTHTHTHTHTNTHTHTHTHTQIWDIGGQENFRAMTRAYYRGASGCVIMFDITDKTSFEHAKDWKDDLDAKVALPNGETIPCILLANKVAACTQTCLFSTVVVVSGVSSIELV